MSALDIGITTIEDATFLKLSGVIDEDNTLAGSLKKITGRTVILDLAKVVRINSCGVRDWVNWLNDLESRGKQVVLVRCSPCIVNQINMVHNFTGGGMVKSFFAPYYCPKCDREDQRLLRIEEFAGQATPKAPAHRGAHCEGVQNGTCAMEFDDIEASYFAFLPHNLGKVVDPRLDQLLQSVSPDLRARIQKLDEVRRESDGGRGSLSAQYSPLTVTQTGIQAIGPEPEETTPAEPEKRRSGLMPLMIIAASLIAGIIAYVVTVVGE
ncbi:MAG: hypothetical protein ACE366_26730 [Bradymonadia bacterium]